MTMPRHVSIGKVTLGNDLPFGLLAGPCQMESRDHGIEMAHALVEMTERQGIPLIFKASFDKANRTSLSGERGIGLERALEAFSEIRHRFGCPVITDIHTEEQCVEAASVVDVLQIPAFLCRQTDLLLAAGRTGKAINIKKGQFLAPWDMTNVAAKIASTGNERIMLCERGTSFGYNTLVTDMRSLPQMARTGYPVVFDATHSVQQPGGQGGSTGGQREFAPVLSRAAVAIGVAAVFIETHADPDKAPSDGPNMIPLAQMPDVISVLSAFDRLAKSCPLTI